jgi:hypothetical protein
MSVNRFQPHVLVLPEDRANSQLANGFWLFPSLLSRRMQVLPYADGWLKVLESFEANHANGMRENVSRFMVLLIDFDNHLERLQFAQCKIPPDLAERVFILGALIEPEDLKRAGLGTLEEIGSALARDCQVDTNNVWQHEHLRHNASELKRLREHVRPILFA